MKFNPQTQLCVFILFPTVLPRIFRAMWNDRSANSYLDNDRSR